MSSKVWIGLAASGAVVLAVISAVFLGSPVSLTIGENDQASAVEGTSTDSNTAQRDSDDSEFLALRLLVVSEEDQTGIEGVNAVVADADAAKNEVTDELGYVTFRIRKQSTKVTLNLIHEDYETWNRNDIDIEAYAEETKKIQLKKKLLN